MKKKKRQPDQIILNKINEFLWKNIENLPKHSSHFLYSHLQFVRACVGVIHTP